MAFIHGEELIMGVVVERPEPETGIRGAAAEIGLVACEERVFVGNVPVDAGHAEILGGCLRAYVIVDADLGVALEQSTVGSRVKGQHSGRSRIDDAGGAAVVGDISWSRHVVDVRGIQHLLNSFIVHEEKNLVLLDGAAQSSAELVSTEWGRGIAGVEKA